MTGVFLPFFRGEHLFVLTNWQAPNWRVLAIDLNSPGRDGWRDIVPESRCRIRDFAIADHRIFVGYVEKFASRIEIFDLAGQRQGVLPCPPHGTVRLLPCKPSTDTIFYGFTS